jgi:peptidoglycan/LPS O-acetylase OafA/YrhL
MGGRTPPPLWSFLTFTQNFGLQPGTAFSHAWSLCIEEQFYLVLPLLLVGGVRLEFGRLQGWMLIAGLIALGVAARTLLWFRYGLEGKGIEGYYPNVYYATLCRFDEFLPGVAVAVVKHFHRPLWSRLMQHGQALLAAGAAATTMMLYCAYRFYYIDGYGYGFFMTALGYSLIAVAFALLVLAALSPTSWLARIRIPGAYHLALWSYSIYLSHKAVGHILAQPLKSGGWSSPAILLAVTLASLFCGWLLYRLVEAPFMTMRDRWFPTLFLYRQPIDKVKVSP